MDSRRKPWEEPQANYNRQHERNRAGARSASAPRQDQQQHRNEGGRPIGGNGQHDHRPRGRNAQQVGGHREPRYGGGWNEHGAERQHEQRGGRPHEHRGGRRNEQQAGGRNEHGAMGGEQRAYGAGRHNEQRGGHQAHGMGFRNEQGNSQRRENPNREERGNYREQPERPRRDRENGREQQVRRLGYKALEELLEKEPSEVAITLASHPGLRELMLATEMRPDMVELLCKAVCKACTARLERQNIQHLLGIVKSSEYIRACLPRYVVGMMTEPMPERRQRYPDNIHNILSLLQEIISIFPASSIRETSMLVALIPNSINALRASGIEVKEHIEQNLERVSNLIQHLQDRRREGTLRVDSHIVIGPEAPDEDFRTISVYPSFEEIHLGANPFLRQNNLHNKFESTDIYLDTHFRLLREDFVRPLRNGIQEILQHDDRGIRKMKLDDIRIYFKTRLISPMCTSSGIIYTVQFDITPLKRIRWQNSKRLLYGSLVCLSQDSFESFLFATVSNRDAKELEKGEVQLQFCEQSRELLARTRPADSFVMVETTAYFEAYRHVLEGLKEMNAQDVPFQKYIVSCEKDVRVPQYLNAGNQYDLSCMISKEKKDSLAFRNKINILNPYQWPSKEDLGFDVSQIEAVRLALTKELAIIQGPPGTGKTYVGLKIAQALLTNTDVWQLNGNPRPILVVCFTNHALDQFLEGIHQFLGSGIVRVGGRSNSEVLKKFNVKELRQSLGIRRNCSLHIRRAFGEVLQEMKESEHKLQEGGQLLKCTTAGVIHEKFLQKHIKEHHWDRLHLVMDDEDFSPPTKGRKSKIVEWLGLGESHFLHPADVARTDFEELDEGEAEEEKLVEIQEEADLIQEERELDDEDEEETVRRRKRRAKMEDNDIADLLLAMSLKDQEPQEPQGPQGPRDKEGRWETTSKQKKKRKQRMKSELKKTDAMTEAEVDQIVNLWRLDLLGRWRLYRYWIQLYQQDIRLRILTHEQKYQELADRLSELRQRQDLQILQQAKVIGMTTTGAAKYRRILQEVQPRIVIVEEAAEVLEAHTITTLSSECQHLILIGDHQQLRPSANVYDLAKNFNLEVSLFERLIESKLPYVRLDYQHRMRPEIARLLTPHIYSQLENHPSVLKYENIKGVSSNLFFVKHTFKEEEIKDGKSHQNIHEAEFVVELCKYFLNQEYKPSQITILTTYTGQLFCLRKLMPAKTFSGVKVHVVDKYQGEENDIVLLSLVRSNKEGRVGFLKIANRICVALSRAKMGLYCIGNMDMLSSVPLWSHIIGTLQQKAQVGDHLMLYCQNHPETRNSVRCAKDFQSVPEGGCTKNCETRLECGHVCTRACHPYDQEHKEYQCYKECQKLLCKDGHRCKRKCFEPCGECMVEVEKKIPSCGHLQMVPCSTSENTYRCTKPCEKTLACGHECPKCCGDKCEARCPQEISAQLKCGHTQKIKCWQKGDLESGMPMKCRYPCNALLSCGHQCSGSCDGCFQGRFHMGCTHPCKAALVCSHECQQPCTRDCPPCSRLCQNRCIHSQCKKKCGESCVPCMEPCNWSCEHYQCTRLCSEPCDRPPCNVPCTKKLKCRHQCIGLCGEPCPKKCRICDKDEVTEIFFGFEEDEDACFVQLEDCGHILESTSMDTYMEGQSDPAEGSAIKLKECPKCKTPIRRNLRYGTVINKTLSEIEKVKERILGPATEKNETGMRLKTSLQQMVDFRRNFPEEYVRLQEKLHNPSTQLITMVGLENIMRFYERLARLFGNISKADAEERYDLKERLLQIKKWLEKPRSFLSEQELSDLQTEVARFSYLLKLLVKCKEAKVRITPDVQREITFLKDMLKSNKKFTKEDEIFVKTKLKVLDRTLPNAGLGITDEERVLIVQAMQLTKGHWFKCPNNHIYCITECGGAMEESKCPECKERIGGTQHTLLSTNRLAPEMDGAQHAAWSEIANNMMNIGGLLD